MAHDRSPTNYIIRSVQRFVAESEGVKLSKLLASKRLVIDPRQLDGPLLESCRSPGRDKCVQPLLDAGADPNCTDSDGRTPLFLLIEKGAAKPPIMKILMKAGANPNKATYTSNLSPFHLACKKGLQVCVQVLLGSGAHLDKKDGHGNTPLILAARGGNYTIVRMLLLEGADPNKYNHIHETALHYVAIQGNHDTAVDLLSCHADPNIQDLKGQNALLLAAKNSRTYVVKTLIENESDIFVHDLESGRNALHWAVVNNNVKLAGVLIQAGIDLNAKDKNWQTPFMLALTTGKYDTGMVLLNAGCDVTITDKARNTSLHVAARDGRNDLIRSLLKSGIRVDIKGAGGATPLMLAAYGGHGPVVHRLLGYGADPDLGDRNWATAIMYCMFSTNDNEHIQGVIKELVRANCNLNQKTQLLNFAKTLPVPSQFVSQLEDRMYRPVECSLLRGKMVVFMLLLKAGCDVSGINGDKLLLQTYLYDAGVSPKHRRIMLRYLTKEQKRVKTLLELCRRPLRILLDARGLSRSIALLPVSDHLRQFLNYEDLDMLEDEMKGDNLPSSIRNWGSSSSLAEKPGTPKSPSTPKSPLTPKSPSTPKSSSSYNSFSLTSHRSSYDQSGFSSPNFPMSPGGDSQHLRRFLDEIPAVKSEEPPLELAPNILEYETEEQNNSQRLHDHGNNDEQMENNKTKRNIGLKKVLPQLNLAKISNNSIDNKINTKETINDCNNKIYEENNNHDKLFDKNLKTTEGRLQRDDMEAHQTSHFNRSNPLRHTTSRIPRSSILSPKRKTSSKPKMLRDDDDMPLSPSSTDSSFSSLSFSTEEDLHQPIKSPDMVSDKARSTAKIIKPVRPGFSRMSTTRRSFHTTRGMEQPQGHKESTPSRRSWTRFTNKT